MGFSLTAWEMFGYGEIEALGRNMIELVVPRALRPLHRERLHACAAATWSLGREVGELRGGR